MPLNDKNSLQFTFKAVSMYIYTVNTTEVLNWKAKITAVQLIKWPGLLADWPLPFFFPLPLGSLQFLTHGAEHKRLTCILRFWWN